MDLQASFSKSNFMMVFIMILVSVLHLYVHIDSAFSVMFQTIACIFIGATRSLQFYQFGTSNTSVGDETLTHSEKSLMTMKTALSIPILATLTLLLAYFIISNNWVVINYIVLAYFMFLATLSLKKYLY